MTSIDVKDLTSRYVAAWNEPGPARRGAARPSGSCGPRTGSTSSSRPRSSGRRRPASAGLEILVLGPDGRIEADYQFIEA